MWLPLPDPLPVYTHLGDEPLVWKMKRQLAPTHPIYYRVVAAGEPSKPNCSPNGGERFVTNCRGGLGHGRTWAGEGGW